MNGKGSFEYVKREGCERFVEQNYVETYLCVSACICVYLCVLYTQISTCVSPVDEYQYCMLSVLCI